MLKYLSALLIFFFFFTPFLAAQTAQDSVLSSDTTPQPRPLTQEEIRQNREAAARRDSVRREREKERARIAAVNDSLRQIAVKDSLAVVAAENKRIGDSIRAVREEQRRVRLIAAVQELLIKHPVYHFDGEPERLTIEIKKTENDEGQFYFLVGLLLYFAMIRLVFYNYLSAMFTLFFRSTLRRQQLREQLLQAPLPGMLLNLFFLINAGVYCAFLAFHYGFSFARHFWITAAYCVAFVGIIYLVKYIVLKITGWIFGISHATDTYIFIVFMVNKMLGIFLLPILVLMAFPSPVLFPTALAISFIMIILLFIYRFALAYSAVRNEIKLTGLHFFLYLCAFEIAPLLLIYRVLLSFLISSY
ncbi:MAG TPA: DUF4271 domain-containing protein [Flavitalea sp.]|nr:DUF4271 domain-containing protein [Flavitalea sp.]